jgi:hypothetical protein
LLDRKNLEPSKTFPRFILRLSGLIPLVSSLIKPKFDFVESLRGSRISAIELGLEIMRGFLPGIRLEVISKSP